MAGPSCLKRVGYWAPTEDEPSSYPHPRRAVNPAWRAADRGRIVAYLRSGHLFVGFLGYSTCRFRCGIANSEMGSGEFTDGEWVWPEGLAHYVEAHHVCLPEELVASMERNGWRVPAEISPLGPEAVDEAFWLEWGSRLKGASGEPA